MTDPLTPPLRCIAGARPRRRRSPRSPAAAAQTVDEIKKKGELTVGMLVDFPPYGIDQRAEPARRLRRRRRRLLAKDLGVKLNLVPVTGPNRIPFLLTNKVDLLVASLGDHAGARQAGAVLASPTPASTIVLYGAKKADDQGAGRPEGPARSASPAPARRTSRSPRSRRRAPRSAASTTTPRPCRRCCRARSTRSAARHASPRRSTSARPPATSSRSSCCAQQVHGHRAAPGPDRAAQGGQRLRRRDKANGELNKLYQKWLAPTCPTLQKP